MDKQNPFKQLRSGLGLTQAEFGKTLGVTPGRISQLEYGINGSASAAVIRNLLEAYGDQMHVHSVTVVDLLNSAAD